MREEEEERFLLRPSLSSVFIQFRLLCLLSGGGEAHTRSQISEQQPPALAKSSHQAHPVWRRQPSSPVTVTGVGASKKDISRPRCFHC